MRSRAPISRSSFFAGHAANVVLGFDRPNIRLAVKPKQDSKKQFACLSEASQGRERHRLLPLAQAHGADASYLEANGIRALPYHAGMGKEAREATRTAS